jgi:hypothetical protein
MHSSSPARVKPRSIICRERRMSAAPGGPTIGSGYELTGSADFNRDGKPDYALYKARTRQTALYYLNNDVYAGSAYGPIVPAGWNLPLP